MEEYEYLVDLNNDELEKIIIELLDFEETTKALMLLGDRDSDNALKLGKEIIKDNRGDDFLQATTWNIIFANNMPEMLSAIEERKQFIGKVLLDEIIIDLTNSKIDLSKDLLMKIRNTYLSLSAEEQQCMECNYDMFECMYLFD